MSEPEMKWVPKNMSDSNDHSGGVCGQCAFFQRPAHSEKGICHGLPPDLNSGGFTMERYVSAGRLRCSLFQKRALERFPEPTLSEVKQQAKEIGRVAVETGLAQVTAPPATAVPRGKRRGGTGT